METHTPAQAHTQAHTTSLRTIAHSALQNTTPARLLLFLICIWVCAIAFCASAIVTVQQHIHAAITLGVDAAPSIIAAHRIEIGVQKMDADLADELILQPGQYEARSRADEFERCRVNVCRQLVAAAKNITYSTEQTHIENIQIALGKYDMQAQAMRDMHSLGKNNEALKSYLTALQILQAEIVPNTRELNKANIDVLEDTYAREKSASAMSRGLVLGIGGFLTALLVGTQIFLYTRFKRRVNVPLFLSTICTAVFVQHLSSELSESSRNLIVAKEDSYNSVVALLDALADSCDANAAKSRWLVDRQHADIHQKHFSEVTNRVANFAPDYDFAKTIALAQKQMSEHEKLNLPGFSGSLANELNNVRFGGEGEAALEALQSFADYLACDQKMRAQAGAATASKPVSAGAAPGAKPGSPSVSPVSKPGSAGVSPASSSFATAIKIGLGYDPNSSNYFFTKYEDALGRTESINEDNLNLAVQKAIKELNGLVSGSLLLSLFIVICSYLGLFPRIEEYQTKAYLHRRH